MPVASCAQLQFGCVFVFPTRQQQAAGQWIAKRCKHEQNVQDKKMKGGKLWVTAMDKIWPGKRGVVWQIDQVFCSHLIAVEARANIGRKVVLVRLALKQHS